MFIRFFFLFSHAVVFLAVIFEIVNCLHLTAHLSENGIHGTITFRQAGDNTDITLDLTTEDKWEWTIHHFPIDYTEIAERCTDKKLGKRYALSFIT